MENTYGIGVTNRYALFLDEDEDPLEVLKIQEQVKEAKTKTKFSEKENKEISETRGKSLQSSRKGIKDTQNVNTLETTKVKEENIVKSKPPPARPAQERIDKSARFSAGESREDRYNNNRRNRDDKQTAQQEFGRDDRIKRNRDDRQSATQSEVGRDDRNNRRNRDDRQAVKTELGRDDRNNRFNREDRQSTVRSEFGREDHNRRNREDRQTSVKSEFGRAKPVDKREGGGARNWGNYKDDVEVHLNDTQSSNDKPDWTNEKSVSDALPSEIIEKEVESGVNDVDLETAQQTDEPKELTLDEYKALRGNRQKPTFNLRKAGEGEDLGQWKKMYALNKKKEVEEEEDGRYLGEYDASDFPQRVGRQKHILDINIHFADSPRGARSRGRGGPRGGGRGGPRGGLRGAFSGGEQRQSNLVRDRDRIDRPERETYQNRAPRQSDPKVDDERDFPSLG